MEWTLGETWRSEDDEYVQNVRIDGGPGMFQIIIPAIYDRIDCATICRLIVAAPDAIGAVQALMERWGQVKGAMKAADFDMKHISINGAKLRRVVYGRGVKWRRNRKRYVNANRPDGTDTRVYEGSTVEVVAKALDK